jgi:hypothetical protein
MTIHRFRTVLATVVTAVACVLLAAPIAMADKGAVQRFLRRMASRTSANAGPIRNQGSMQ